VFICKHLWAIKSGQPLYYGGAAGATEKFDFGKSYSILSEIHSNMNEKNDRRNGNHNLRQNKRMQQKGGDEILRVEFWILNESNLNVQIFQIQNG